MNTIKKATKAEIFTYAIGGLGGNIPFILMSGYMMYFYTDIFGISAATVGIIVLVGRAIDAVTDPVMGMIADRTKSRWGRYRLWLIVGGPLVGITTFLLFAAPNLAGNQRTVYAFITYILYSLAATMVLVPFHSMPAIMSEDSNQVTSIIAVKQSFVIPSVIFGSILVIPITTGLINSGMQPALAWRYYGLGIAIIITISFWISQLGVRRHDIIKTSSQHKKKNPSLVEQMKLIYKNQPLIMLAIAFGTDLVAFSASMAVNIYFFVYYMNRKDLVAVTGIFSVLVMLIVYPFLPKIARKFGKKRVYLATTASLIVLYVCWYLVPAHMVLLHLFFAFITTAISLFPSTLGWAMIPDCVDYAEWQLGIRGEATVTSIISFINKAGMAIGGVLVGLVIAQAGYVPNAAIQNESTISAIRQVRFLYPMLGYLFSLCSMWFYKLDNATLKEMKAYLLQKNA